MNLLIYAVLGYFGYQYAKAHGMIPAGLATSLANLSKVPAGGAQPSQKYPFKPTAAPRVDNKNQPWNPSTVQQISSKAGPGVSSDIQNLYAGSLIIHNLADVWSTLDLGGSSESAPADSPGPAAAPIQPLAMNDQSNTVGEDSFNLGGGEGDSSGSDDASMFA